MEVNIPRKHRKDIENATSLLKNEGCEAVFSSEYGICTVFLHLHLGQGAMLRMHYYLPQTSPSLYVMRLSIIVGMYYMV